MKQAPLTPSWLWLSMKYLYHPQKSGTRLNWGTATTGTFLLSRTSFFRLVIASAFTSSDTAATEGKEEEKTYRTVVKLYISFIACYEERFHDLF